MVKNWQKFNEAYDESSLHFTREEAEAFSEFYKDKIWGEFCNDNITKKEPFIELLKDLIKIINEEFDCDIGLTNDDTSFALMEPLDKEIFSSFQLPNQFKSTGPGIYLGVENASKTWELLKYKNYKPGYLAKLKLPIDEELKKPRWCHYYQKILQNMNKIPNTQIGIYMGTPTNPHSRHEIGYIPFYVYLRYEDFEFIDPFQDENIIPFLEEYPKHINAFYKWADKDEIFDFIIDNPDVKQYLKGQNLLDFTKKYKSISQPERTQMESENQMYIFIARPAFKEQSDGKYKKDIEIENLVAIDPYDSKDAYALSMMKLRARMQSNNSEVYCIWLPKEFDDQDLRNINDDSMTYLRSLIDQKKEKV